VVADASLTMRRRLGPETEKMTTAAAVLADAGRLLRLGERVNDGNRDGQHG
jgi:hypothetical protein